MRYGVFNRGLKRLGCLSELLGGEIAPALFHAPEGLDATLGWGRRKYAAKAIKEAAAARIPFICLEDGFLRSVGGGGQEPPLSVVVDDIGIYYDATSPSRLEALISKGISSEEQTRARALIAAWRAARVSKYNYLREFEGHLPARYVLVVDQTYGDAAIRYGLADGASFQRMLDAAVFDNPDCTVLVKIHPDVFARRKKGYFDPARLTAIPSVQVLAEGVHPVGLIEKAQALYAVTSQMGFEGLLWGKPVRTFGMPFYAGWGLTRDELPAPERRRPVPLENLVHAALVEYPRYIDPETGKRCQPERLIEWMGLQRRMRARFPRRVYAFGFSAWKRKIVKDFLQGSEVRFINRSEEVPADGVVAVWGRGGARAFSNRIKNLIRIEDGFLRSVGLGADLVRPLSWVMDACGMYYDATAPSDLENLLQDMVFAPEVIERAANLRRRIVAGGLTKYNVGAGQWRRPEVGGRRVILVPGQVETDASIRWGAPGIKTNIGLLRAVRETNAEAFLVYKSHPDVAAGLRRKGEGEEGASRWCDEIVVDVGMHALVAAVDEVHVLTSLAGFEALLREKTVVTYGHPFYAGWGLTRDMVPLARRTRKLSLDELVAGALIEYPTYVSRTTGRFTTPERALDELLAWRQAGAAGLPWWRKGLRWVLRWRKR